MTAASLPRIDLKRLTCSEVSCNRTISVVRLRSFGRVITLVNLLSLLKSGYLVTSLRESLIAREGFHVRFRGEFNPFLWTRTTLHAPLNIGLVGLCGGRSPSRLHRRGGD